MILDREKPGDINNYLQSRLIIRQDEEVLSAEKPGEGNMNCVVRAVLPSRTLILKQARSYVEKYPSIPAPEERVIIESEFYKMIRNHNELKSSMPAIVDVDEANHILIMEDLGEANDFTVLYQQANNLSTQDAKALSKFLSGLHNNLKKESENELMANRKLRALNHEHIFVYPLMKENGFDLNTIQPGLQELAIKYKSDEALKAKAKLLGEIYLSDGDVLLHGDYYPGSWLQTKDGVKIIDPEFCFYGKPEFDLGVMLAHLKMAQQSIDVIDIVSSFYKKSNSFDDNLLNGFMGMEIIRRLIGLAQLPLKLTLEEKEGLLNYALDLMAEYKTEQAEK
jgi:5-methylthioribose kinase